MNNRGILFGQREEDIVSLRNLFRSTVSGKVFHLFLLASSTIQFKEAGKGRGNILIGNILKTIFSSCIYIYIYNEIFMFNKRDIIFFTTNFLLQLELVEIELDFGLCTRCWTI